MMKFTETYNKIKRLTPSRVLCEFTRQKNLLIKEFRQLCSKDNSHPKNILFILGCQRSGTTLLQQIFERDMDARVYKESSRLCKRRSFFNPDIRLKSFDELKTIIKSDRFPFIIAKPLVESQNVLKLHEYFPEAKFVWLYRHYKDVAASDLARWGIENGISNLRPILKNNDKNWRSEHLPEHLRKIIISHFSEDMNPYDAAALFWFIRNSFYVEYDLAVKSNIILLKYESLVQHPVKEIRRIYEFVGMRFPGLNMVKEVHSNSIGKGQHIQLSSEIECLCYSLWKKLNLENEKQQFNCQSQ